MSSSVASVYGAVSDTLVLPVIAVRLVFKVSPSGAMAPVMLVITVYCSDSSVASDCGV